MIACSLRLWVPAQKLLGKEGQLSLVEVAALCAGLPGGGNREQISEVLPYTRVHRSAAGG
jgi:putative ABC transport system permease protein